MTKKQDTYFYELKQGNKTVYMGISKNPEERERQHRNEGKEFGKMQVAPRPMTRDGAEKKEQERLKTYRENHRGKNPKYNKD